MITKFLLKVDYVNGSASMETTKPDLLYALQEFVDRKKADLPDDKNSGLPEIKKAELIPVSMELENV